MSIFLTPEQLAERWHTSVHALAMKRSRGQGPEWTKIGARVLYKVETVEAYETAQKRVSTD